LKLTSVAIAIGFDKGTAKRDSGRDLAGSVEMREDQAVMTYGGESTLTP